ncbi:MULTISPECIES: hypothetical protein [Acetobacter]|jgi:hypothetical protein|uniref:Uncharacterized protein n=1 Tax=Acetobacter lovaniensis TaxID=104100 RepID=A0A841QIQ9_9PROT|nr:hypothetical protein [Acetobacter lovaniensis]MBB6458033.1 hypothetical protein [Acetobacter lovaniensis]MCI1698567.1 hypothetical protein [Acetobacter lovaniensis]MCI1795216.1 hypothetical protein [Acetobacter lovaniensis]MCP1239833.1 hypothetical protein [Acetobacter lovaniensis]NHN82287.1 hypothetical protein [Acetobacter lovaniensis]
MAGFVHHAIKATEQAMTATTGSGSLPGVGNWLGQAGQGTSMADAGAGQATVQSSLVGALPSSTALMQSARTALVAAQAQQAEVMLTLSEGAKTLLDGASSARQPTASADNTATAAETSQNTAISMAGRAPTGAGITSLVADIMRAADTVLNDPAATADQKAMASRLVQLATAMAGQPAGGGGSALAGGIAAALPLLQSLGAPPETPGALGGAVVTTAGLYGLVGNTVQDGRLAIALQGMAGPQEGEIVLPGGIVQFPQDMEAGTVAVLMPASSAGVGGSLTNALSSALLPDLFRALSAVLANTNATDEQKAAATALLQMLETADNAPDIPQALLNPLVAAALMPALSPSQRGRLVRAALAGEVEDMGQLAEAEQTDQPGVAGLRAALRKNAAYLAAVQTPLLDHALELTRKLEAEAVAAALAEWGFAGRSREQWMDEALDVSSIMAFSQNLMADSPYMGALASTSLTPILIMSWAALLSGCLPRAYPFVPRVWRRADKKKWRRKSPNQRMDFQNLLFMGDTVEA